MFAIKPGLPVRCSPTDPRSTGAANGQKEDTPSPFKRCPSSSFDRAVIGRDLLAAAAPLSLAGRTRGSYIQLETLRSLTLAHLCSSQPSASLSAQPEWQGGRLIMYGLATSLCEPESLSKLASK